MGTSFDAAQFASRMDTDYMLNNTASWQKELNELRNSPAERNAVLPELAKLATQGPISKEDYAAVCKQLNVPMLQISDNASKDVASEMPRPNAPDAEKNGNKPQSIETLTKSQKEGLISVLNSAELSAEKLVQKYGGNYLAPSDAEVNAVKSKFVEDIKKLNLGPLDFGLVSDVTPRDGGALIKWPPSIEDVRLDENGKLGLKATTAFSGQEPTIVELPELVSKLKGS
jgi:hypothetical protein